MVKYPFLPQAKRHIGGLELNYEVLANLPRTRERARQRISASFDLATRFSQKPSLDSQTEIASFALATLYASGIGDPRLVELFALYEATQVNEYLREEHEDVILDIARAFNWYVRISEENKQRIISIHFVKYLENATRGRLTHDPKWKLVNRSLDKGWVRVTRYELARLLQEEVKKRIEDNTTQEVAEIPQQLQMDIDELKSEFLKRKPQLEEFDQIIRAQESEYPPCISDLMKRAAKGQHLSHVERFTLVTYLLHQGISVDSIVSLFSSVADFKEDKTRYQVEHLAGKRYGGTKPYVTYNCATLQTHGVCLKPTDPICRAIRNPLTYHIRKQREKRVSEQK
jgi:DNA primase large subunit